MQATSAMAGLVGTVLFVILPLLMLGGLVFLLSARSKTVLSAEARTIGFRVVISHFAGLSLFVAANAIPTRFEPVRVVVACLAILLVGALPCALSFILVKRRILPQTLHTLAYFVVGATGLLCPLLVFAVWMADKALKIIASG